MWIFCGSHSITRGFHLACRKQTMKHGIPSDLTDKQWSMIKPHIPDAKE